MIIDVHTHIFDNTVPGAAENFPLWPGTRWGGGATDLLHQMDEASIQRSVLISYTAVDVMAHYPADVREQRVATFQHYLSKEYFVRTWRAHPDRFLWLANSIDPRVPGYVERAEIDLSMGADGLKLLPPFVDTPIDHPGWTPIFELLRATGKPCTIDLSYWYTSMPWFAPSIYGKYRDYDHYVEGMHTVARRFPDVTILLAHYGTPALVDRGDPTRTIHYDRLDGPLKLTGAHENLHLDLAAYQHLIAKDEPFPYMRAQRVVEILVTAAGADRVVWGTDWPYLGEQPYSELIRSIRAVLGESDAAKVLGGNAQRIFGLTDSQKDSTLA